MKIKFLTAFICFLSCVAQKNTKEFIITSKGTGNYRLGQKLVNNYNKDDLDIICYNNSKIIKEIFIKSDKYKTNEGYGIGISLDQLQEKTSTKTRTLDLYKDKITIGTLGKGIFYKNIWFIDMDKNNKVDTIWLSND